MTTVGYTYQWGGATKRILYCLDGDTVTCNEFDAGEPGASLGVYVWTGFALTGTGSLTNARREAIAARLIVETLPE
jgi:hypothetical protein